MKNIIILTVFFLCGLGCAVHYAVLATLGDPLNAGTLLSAAGALFFFLTCLLRLRGTPLPIGSRVRKAVGVCCMLWLASFAVFSALITHYARGCAGVTAKHLIILGGGIKGSRPSLSLALRIERAAEFMRRHPEVVAVASGGRGPDELVSEGALIRRILVERGIDGRRIAAEERSFSTFENIRNSREVFRAQGVDIGRSGVMILTSDFHVMRAVLIARSLGIAACGIPAETPWYLVPNYYFRESLAFLKTLVYDIGLPSVTRRFRGEAPPRNGSRPGGAFHDIKPSLRPVYGAWISHNAIGISSDVRRRGNAEKKLTG